jgi:LuxR family maltose regulon positive regulatory protein
MIREGRMTSLLRWLDELDWPEAEADPQLAVVRALALGLADASADVVERWLTVAENGTHIGPLANGMPSVEFGVSLVRSLFLLGDVGRAAAAGRLASEQVEEGSEWQLEALLGYGQSLYLAGRASAARKALEQALRESRPNALQSTATILAYLALIELDQGQMERGEALARRSIALLEDGAPGETVAAGGGHLALGVALGAGGAFAEAEAEIERGVRLRASSWPTVWHAHGVVLLARARLARGDLVGARQSFEAAQVEVESLRDPGIVASILDDTERRLSAGIRRPVSAGEELSERELVILRLLAAGLTKPEIARELYIAYNTVKTHTRTIYRKLDASTRDDAVAHARELKLI